MDVYGLRLDYRLRLWVPTSASRAISAVAELLVSDVDVQILNYKLYEYIKRIGVHKALL